MCIFYRIHMKLNTAIQPFRDPIRGPYGDISLRSYRVWPTLAQVMACCLTAPSHYLNQCWLIIGRVRFCAIRLKQDLLLSPKVNTRPTNCVKHLTYSPHYRSVARVICCFYVSPEKHTFRHFIMKIITGLKLTHVSKRGPWMYITYTTRARRACTVKQLNRLVLSSVYNHFTNTREPFEKQNIHRGTRLK